jgi:signal transduction histidine kinase
MDAGIEEVRKLHSLLELGQLIGFDLQLNEILLKIAQKAVGVMDADRCSLFLYDPKMNELWSTVALGMGERIIRIPSDMGIVGYCFKTGEAVNLKDAYQDSRFNKEVDLQTGYHTRTILCLPLYDRAGEKLGVIQTLNKKEGVFSDEDEAFLRTLGNHASVFIEMAQLQRARIEALEESRAELERLNRVKSKALDHLSHELRTPLSVIQGILKLLSRKIKEEIPGFEGERFFKTLERHLRRLTDIQHETDSMIRSYREARIENLFLYPIVEQVLEGLKRKVFKRDLRFHLEGPMDLIVKMDRTVLEEILEGLLKNAIENTPDEGLVRVLIESKPPKVVLKVEDFGIGITPENKKFIFDGLFHTQDTDLYTSKTPYDFYAGGKGLDLHRIKVYGEQFGFNLSVESRRCDHLPTDRDLCPGRISSCPHCNGLEDCVAAGGSVFTISFPAGSEVGRTMEKVA